MENRDLDASSFLASSKLGSATRLGNQTCILLMIPPLLLDSWNYNNGMTCYYEICRGYYFLLRHPTFRRRLSIRRHKRHKRPCIYYSGSSATFHPLLIGDLVFKLNPGPTEIRRILAIVSSRDVNVNNNTAASTGVGRNIKNLIRITCCYINPIPLRPLNFCSWNFQSTTQSRLISHKDSRPRKFTGENLTIKLTVTCETTLFVVSLTKLVASRPRNSSETFLLGKLVWHHAKSPVR